jgi:hypothetical protein
VVPPVIVSLSPDIVLTNISPQTAKLKINQYKYSIKAILLVKK